MDTRLPTVMSDGPLPSYLRSMLEPHAKLVPWTLTPGTGAEDQEVRAVFTYSHPIVDAALLDRFPNLLVVSNHGVGVDHIDVAAAVQRGIPVGNTPGVLDGGVADLGFALLLTVARRIIESNQFASDRDTREFDQSMFHGQEVHGSNLGIVGMGRIGRQIARRASGFDMNVLYHNRHRDSENESKLRARYVSLERILRESDFVMITVPLTKQTTGMIGAEQLALMKSTAILINIARGPIVDTGALVSALRKGQLHGAALDVTHPEPLPRDHPLLSMPNVLVTSHIGSASVRTRRKMAELSVENLVRGLAGQELKHHVTAAS